MSIEIDQCTQCFRDNIEKGIREGLYRSDLNVEVYVRFYYTRIFHINENTVSESEAQRIELEALEYHTRAMATEKGVEELEKQLKKLAINYPNCRHFSVRVVKDEMTMPSQIFKININYL